MSFEEKDTFAVRFNNETKKCDIKTFKCVNQFKERNRFKYLPF